MKDWSTTVEEQLLLGYLSLMPSCAVFVEPRKSRLGLSKSTFNAENFMHNLSNIHVYLDWFRRNLLLKYVS